MVLDDALVHEQEQIFYQGEEKLIGEGRGADGKGSGGRGEGSGGKGGKWEGSGEWVPPVHPSVKGYTVLLIVCVY